MNIDIIAVGKAKRDPAAELYQTYIKRLDWSVHLTELPSKTSTSSEEHDVISKTIDKKKGLQSVIIAMDERGQNITSVKLADQFQNWMNDGKSHAIIIVGGADGLSEDLRQKADLVLSLGKLTWPHMMVRAMLAEQLYRVRQIIAGHPYHRS